MQSFNKIPNKNLQIYKKLPIMGMIYQNISSEDSLFNDVSNLYIEAFPKDERRKINDLAKILNKDSRFNIVAILQEASFTGFISYWHFEKFHYIEHFAIQPDKRNLGLGKLAINHIKAICSGFPIIIEVEPDIDSLTHRRIEFYKRSNFDLRTDVKYLQPPYSPEKNPLELNLMTYGKCGKKELQEYAKVIQTEVYLAFY